MNQQKIIDTPAHEQFKDDYIRYAIYITYKRVLADYRDGLKPVQRRILVASLLNSKAITSTVKTAAIVGDVMKYYHGHGSCLDYNTLIYDLDGNAYKIGDIYNSGCQEMNILAIDPITKEYVPAIAHSFRIGQYTNKLYHVNLSNGYTITCTSNHPFMMIDGSWIRAEDIKPNTRLFSDCIYAKDGRRPTIHDKTIHSIVNNYYSGQIQKEYELTVENYFKYKTSSTNTDPEKMKTVIEMYKIERPYVLSVTVENVPSTPMYDFTVDGYENMMIPVKAQSNYLLDENIGLHIPFICVHNSGIEGAIKPMTNWFEEYIPLIDGQGNFGTFQGQPQAAARYTENKLSKFAIEVVLNELMENNKVVDWEDTYDNKNKEPSYLPCKVPLLLINGSFGIGLGLKAEIPTHNINEVIDATINLIKNPDNKVILAPDHCMECEIFDTDWENICETGFGYYRVRGVIDVEDYNNRKALIIRSVPNLTFLDTITDKIDELIADKKIIQIEKAFDKSHIAKGKKGDRDVMQYVIILKPGADPEFVKDVIYKNTKLEQKIRINFETLNGLNLMRMSYKSYLLSFIDLRKMTKYRLYTNKLQDVQTKIHEREAYITALESGKIDEIIAMIRKRTETNDSELVSTIMKMLNITDLQASYIANVNIKKLSEGYLQKYKEDAAQLELEKQNIINHLTNPELIEQEIVKELLDIKQKYGCPRRCKIIKPVESNDIPKGEMIVVVTEKNYIKKIPVNTPIGSFKGDSIKDIIRVDNTSNILIFDEMGKVFKLPVHKIPFSDRMSNGTDIRFIIKGLTANISAIIPEDIFLKMMPKNNKISSNYLITVTKSGLIKRMSLDDFVTVPPSGIIYVKIDEGDNVQDVLIAHESADIMVYSDRKAIKIPVSQIPFLKRNTKGSRAMSNAGDIDGMCIINPEKASDLIVITKSGRINRLHIISLLETSRGKNGFNVIKLNKNDSIHSIITANPTDTINIKTINGTIKVPVNSIQYGSSISAGYNKIPTKGDQILRCFSTRQ